MLYAQSLLNSFVTTEIMKLVLAIAGIVLSAVAVYAVALAKKHLSPDQIAVVVEIARIVTLGVEQIAPTLGLNGPAKYAEAVSRAASLLASHGIALSATDLQTYIESAVRELKAAGQELIAPTPPSIIVTTPAVPLASGDHP